MTIKHLVVSGCSFSDNHGSIWPKYLAEKLQIPLYNRAQDSSGNDWISKTILYQLNLLLKAGIDAESILVLPMWTSPARKHFFVSKNESSNFESLSAYANRINFLNKDPNIKLTTSDDESGYILGSLSCRFTPEIEEFKSNGIRTYFPREALAMESYEHFLRIQWFCECNNINLLNLCWMDIVHYPDYEYRDYGKDVSIHDRLTKDIFKNVSHLHDMIDFNKWVFWKESGGLYEYGVDNNLEFSSDGFHPEPDTYRHFVDNFLIDRIKERFNI